MEPRRWKEREREREMTIASERKRGSVNEEGVGGEREG